MSHATDSDAQFEQNNVQIDTEASIATKEVTTFEGMLDVVGFGTFQFYLLQVCGLGWLVDGVFLSMISFALPVIQQFWNLSPLQAGALGSIIFLGMMIGAFLGGFVSDRYGRRLVMVVGMSISSVGTLASAFSPSYYFLIFFRFFVGLGLGAIVPTDFSYFMEYIPKAQRGTYLGIMNMYWSVGSISVCLLAWLFMPNWRLLMAVSSIPGFLSLILRVTIDESPRYLLIHGQQDAVKLQIKRIAIWNRVKTLPPFSLKGHHGTDEKNQGALEQLKQLFSNELKGTTFLLCGMWFLLSYGSWGFGFLLPIVFVKIHSSNVYLNSLLVLFCGLIGYIAVTIVVEKFSRRRLMGISLILCGIITSMIAAWDNPIFVLVIAICTNFIAAFPWEIMYTYTSEVYPTSCRATGMGLCSTLTRLGGTVTPLIGEALLSQAYFIPFLTYGVALGLCGVLALFLPYETLGRELTDFVGERDRVNEVSEKSKDKDPSVAIPLIADDK